VLDVKLSTQKTLNGDEGELEVALLKAFMGMVEAWELENAPDEVQAAFGTAVRHLWRQGKRARPRLKRESIPRIGLLLDRGLAIEVEGYIEIPCVTEGWQAVEKHRVQTRARKAKLRERVRNAGGTRSERVPSSPAESLGISNGTPPATRARKILDPKILVLEEEGIKSPKASPSPEAKPRPARARLCPPTWQPDLRHAALATELRIDLAAEVEKFRDYEFGVPKSDWDATFRNWLRNAGTKPRPRSRQPTADERKLEAIRRSDMLFDNWGEGHEPERSQANREQPEHALSSRLVGRTNDPVRH
jgi:hypothetical protein